MTPRLRAGLTAATLAAACLSLPGPSFIAAPDTRPVPGPDCVECPHYEAPPAPGPTLVIPTAGLDGERLVVEGTVFRPDGRTPASGVLVYAYHTSPAGIYLRPPGATGMARWHGALRGWLRTGADGRYRIETIRPGPYPNGTIPAHIHMHVMPPGGRERWIDDIVFADDPLVDAAYRARVQSAGGSGIVTLTRNDDGILHARRDIVLPE